MKRKRLPSGRRPGRPKHQAPDDFNARVLRIPQWATSPKPLPTNQAA